MKNVVISIALICSINIFAQNSNGVLERLEKIPDLVHKFETHNYKHLEDVLKDLLVTLETLDPEKLTAEDKESILKSTNEVIQKSMNIRFGLVEKIPEWTQTGEFSNSEEVLLRKVILGLRYFEDSVGEYSLGLGKMKDKPMNLKGFTFGKPFTMTADGNPFLGVVGSKVTNSLDTNAFKPGDVLLMRGSSEVSAAIARITDVNTQFSHLAIITKNPFVDDGKLYVAESLIEKGLVLTPIQDFVDHAVGRTVLFRSKDPQAAQKASDRAWTRATDGFKYLYNFTMATDKDPKITGMFCSQVVEDAYQGLFKDGVPLMKSTVNPVSREFLTSIGVSESTKTVFTPADIELDHRFQMVAEFRDLSKTPQQRVYDVILDKVFQWLDEGGAFRGNRLLSIMTNLGYNLSKIEVIKKLAWKLGVPIAPHVSPKVLQTVISMALIRGPLLKELQPMIDAYVERVGVVPPPYRISEWLETIRERGENPAFKFFKLPKKFGCDVR